MVFPQHEVGKPRLEHGSPQSFIVHVEYGASITDWSITFLVQREGAVQEALMLDEVAREFMFAMPSLLQRSPPPLNNKNKRARDRAGPRSRRAH